MQFAAPQPSIVVVAGTSDRSPGLFAHYLNNKTVRITDSIRPIGGEVIAVSGKREARRIAAERGARCWNF
jgi:hypothetical protein